MKRVTLTWIFVSAFIFHSAAQTPNWKWANKAGKAKGDRASSICSDLSGNIYVCGEFQSAQISWGNNTGYGSDFFIAKYDNNDNVIWARVGGGTDHDVVTDIAVDAQSNVYVTGYFVSPQIIFPTATLINTSSGSSDIFIAKYDNNGAFLWARSAGGAGNDVAKTLSVDATGNVFVAGEYKSNSIVWGTNTLLNANAGTSDIFIFKLDATGSPLWSIGTGGMNDDEVTALCTGVNGEIYIAGNFKSSAITFGTSTLMNAGGSDLFFTKLDANGNFPWAFAVGGSTDDSVHCISADNIGNIYLGGEFSSDSITFGSNTLVNTTNGNSDAFITKVDSLGSIIWCKSISGTGNESATGISSEVAGNICITGSYSSQSITIDSTILSNASQADDIFIVKYDNGGNILWTKKASGLLNDESTGIEINSAGDILLVGYFSSPGLNMGPGTIQNLGYQMTFMIHYESGGTPIHGDPLVYSTLNEDKAWDIANDSHGNSYITGWFRSSSLHFDSIEVRNKSALYDVFTAKYDPLGKLEWAQDAGGNGWDFGGSICVDPFDNIYATGFFSDSIMIGSVLLPGPNKIFIAKYDSTGNVLWAKEYGDATVTYDICTDLEGNIYIAGTFTGTTSTFGSFTLTNNSPSYTDVFILKLDSSGNILWAKSAGGNNNDFASGISVDPFKNLYVSGYFSSNMILFDSTTFVNGHPSGLDYYLAKYDSSGTLLWATGAGDQYNDEPNSLCSDASGNAYITGFFAGPTLVIGSTTLTNPAVSIKETFIAKYNSDGTVAWAKSAGGTDYDEAMDIDCDAYGNVYQTGWFVSSSITFGSFVLPRIGSQDIFITKYDSSGNVIWAKSTGGLSSEMPSGISILPNGKISIAGSYSTYYLPFGTDTLTCMDGYNIFVAQLDSMMTTNLSESNTIEANTVFPNPFSSITTLRSRKFLESASLILYNSLGQTVSRVDNINGYEVNILRNDLPNGLYFVQLMKDDKVFTTKKIVIAGE